MVHPDGRFYYRINGEVFNFSEEVLKHAGKEIEPSEEPFATQWAEKTATQYQRDRQAEYPSLLELTVALYDTDDKSAVEAKRASVKLKYPKP
tara:strand:+ start:657 stop:932 length:276 start_codon:yes stop_codon:yes gene_type:complete